METNNLISKIRNFYLHLAEVIYKWGLQCRPKYCILEGHEDLLIFHNDVKLLTMFICYGIYFIVLTHFLPMFLRWFRVLNNSNEFVLINVNQSTLKIKFVTSWNVHISVRFSRSEISILLMSGLLIINYDIFTKVKFSKRVWKFWTIMEILGKFGLR